MFPPKKELYPALCHAEPDGTALIAGNAFVGGFSILPYMAAAGLYRTENSTFGSFYLKIEAMKIAMTGGSGHVGNVLCRNLVKNGYQVKVLVHENEDDLLAIGADILKGNVLDQKVVDELCRNADVVFHLAAKISIDKKDRELVYKTNVEGTQHVINGCRMQNTRLIHFSTIHTYGTHNALEKLDESAPVIDFSPINYENSKAEAERRVMKAAAEGMHAVVLNPTAIIGPFDYQPSLLGQALIKIHNNALPMLVEGGYDFVDVRDVVDAAIAAADRGRSGEKYILSGHWLSLKELSKTIAAITGRKTPTLVASRLVAQVGLPFIQAYASITGNHPLYTAESLEILKSSHRNISNEKARKELGMNTRPIEESLTDIFEWYKNHKML